MAERFPYEDIVNLPAHISDRYPQATMAERAARFSPFAAIAGYEDMVREEARVTEKRRELGEDEKSMLDERLRLLAAEQEREPTVTLTYFVPDQKKDGGAYLRRTGVIVSVDRIRREIRLKDGSRIPLDDIFGIETGLFEGTGLQ